MSILNRASDGLFNIVVVFVRCLAEHGRMKSEKLIDVCAPLTGVSDSQKQAKQTLNRWVELGLFVVTDTGDVAIGEDFAKSLQKAGDSDRALSRILRGIVLAERNNENFWSAEGNQSADFTRAVCWMLAQDVTRFRPVAHRDVQEVELGQLSHDAAFTNDTRWFGFKSWAPFLGFGYVGRHPVSSFWVDPTVAVRDALPNVFGRRKELSQADFFAKLAELLPVIDGGIYRVQVESRIKGDWRAPREHEISTSLSRSLRRLFEADVIELLSRADAEKVTLLGPGNVEDRSVSHVVLKVTQK